MPEFIYEALNEDESVTGGRISAESVSEAVVQLEAQGLQIISIQNAMLATDAAQAADDSPADSEVSAVNDQQALRQRLAEVLEQRDILAPALAAFAEELPSGRSRRELSDLVARMQSGATAEDFCSMDDRAASWLLLLGRGAGSHRLLSDLFDEAMHENESQALWNRAFIYPTFVSLGAFGVLIFLCIAVVPTFTSIFDDFDLELPGMTSLVVTISNTILRNPVGFMFGTLAAIVGVYTLFRLIRIWGLPSRLGNKLTMGNSLQVTTMARFTRRLAEALDAGLELPTALRLAGRAEGRGSTRRLALQLADDTEQKNFDLKNLASARRFPTTVVHALQAGSGNSPSIPLLRQLAELYTTRIRDRNSWATGFIAQFVIVGVGLTVGFVVLAMFLPLVSLIEGLS